MFTLMASDIQSPLIMSKACFLYNAMYKKNLEKTEKEDRLCGDHENYVTLKKELNFDKNMKHASCKFFHLTVFYNVRLSLYVCLSLLPSVLSAPSVSILMQKRRFT